MLIKNRKIFFQIRKKIEKFPLIRYIIFRIYQIIWKIIIIIIFSCNKKPNLFNNKRNLVYINPDKIIYYQDLNHKFLYGPVKFLDGEWDLLKNLKFFNKSHTKRFESFYEHFILNKKWEETHYFKTLINGTAKYRSNFGCLTKDDVIKRFEYIDRLYNKIKMEGYKTQKELIEKNGCMTKTGQYTIFRDEADEILIGIGRDGIPIFLNGRHRLTIAKLLNLESIPVKVQVIHPKAYNLIKNKKIDYIKLNKND